jgi:hypothetical protein
LIASFHLVHFRKRHFVQSKGPDAIPGLRYWKPLSIGPDFKALSANFSRWDLAKPNFKRWGFFAVWEDDAALDAFLNDSAIPKRWNESETEVWHARLNPGHSSGTWHGEDPIGKIDAPTPAKGPVAVLTRGELHPSKALTFWRTATRVAVKDILQVPGFLAGVALVEKPLLEVMTFTLWNSSFSAMDFARQRSAHSGLIERDRTEHIFRAFYYAHFSPYRSEGSWYGENPLPQLAGIEAC